MSKKPQDNTKPKFTAITRLSSKNLREVLSWRQYANKQTVHDVADALYEWAHKEESIDFHDFYREVGIPETTIDTWRTKYPYIQEAYLESKKILGSRLRRHGIYKKNGADASMILETLHMYHPDFALKAKEKEAREEYLLSLKFKHDEKMALMRKEQDEGTLGKLEKFFAQFTPQLPELHDKPSHNIPARNNRKATEV